MMAEVPSGDPGGNPTSSPQNVMLFPSRELSPTPEFRPRTRGYKRPRNSLNSTTVINRTPDIQFTSGNGENTVRLEDLAGLIADLKKIIVEQGNTIGDLKADLTQIKSEQNSLKTQNAKLHEEIRSLCTQLSTYTAPPSPPRSYASAAASGGATGSQTTLPTARSTKNPHKEVNCIRISTQLTPANPPDTAPSFTRHLPPISSNSFIRTALLSGNATKDVQVAGVGTTKTGYIIRFKDPQSAETARNHTEWLGELGNGTKLVKPRFGVVVHRVPTAEFLLPASEKQGIQKIMEDNELAAKGFQVEEITWLKRPDKPLGAHASMGIWFNTAEAAEWIVNNGMLFGQQYLGSVEYYQIKQKRCYRCQKFGHLAWACKEQPRCGHCAGEHERQNCIPGTTARCVDCQGLHPTGARSCQGSANLPSQQ